MIRNFQIEKWGFLFCWLTIASVTEADGVAVTTIENGTPGAVRGITAVNLSAGSNNIQFNGIGLAASKSGIAAARVHTRQRTQNNLNENTPSVAIVHIGKDAYKGAQGVVAINQSSGLGNIQANGVAIAVSIEGKALADNDFDQGLPDARPPEGTQAVADRMRRRVSIQDNAFAGARGIVQVNQAAGAWNAAANSFALRISAGAVP